MSSRNDQEEKNQNAADNAENVRDSEEIQNEKTTVPKKKRWLRVGIGVGVGALVGFGYYYFVGCSSGGCPLTSNPAITTSYGALLGGIVASG